MFEEPDQGDSTLEELKRRLAVVEASRRRPSPYLDRVMSILGEAEIVIGALMFFFTPFDATSIVLGAIGGMTWVYDRLVKEPRETREIIESNRQIDLLRSEVDRLMRR